MRDKTEGMGEKVSCVVAGHRNRISSSKRHEAQAQQKKNSHCLELGDHRLVPLDVLPDANGINQPSSNTVTVAQRPPAVVTAKVLRAGAKRQDRRGVGGIGIGIVVRMLDFLRSDERGSVRGRGDVSRA